MRFAVWSWEENSNWFVPYSSLVSTSLEYCLAIKHDNVCLGDIEPPLSRFTVSIPRMVQTSETGTERAIKRTIIDSSHPFSKGYIWEWQMYTNIWISYGVEEAQQISMEKSRKRWTFTLANRPTYSIDLLQSIQTNINTNFQRQIRKRKDNPYPTVGIPDSMVQDLSDQNSSSSSVPDSMVQGLLDQNSSSSSVPSSSKATYVPIVLRNYNRNNMYTRKQSLPTSSKAALNGGSQTDSFSDLSDLMAKCFLGRNTGDFNEQDCKICGGKLANASNSNDSLLGIPNPIIELSKCKHSFHNHCLKSTLQPGSAFVMCPTCRQRYGEEPGCQPKGGTMTVSFDDSVGLAGYEKYDTILVTYNFSSSGISNGRHYSAIGLPCTAYFPANSKGKKVVRLLRTAFEKRLVFRIDASNSLVLNDLEHKTSLRHGSKYGYPDSGYLDRILAVLRQKGVF